MFKVCHNNAMLSLYTKEEKVAKTKMIPTITAAITYHSSNIQHNK
jgi:hypothetical protein